MIPVQSRRIFAQVVNLFFFNALYFGLPLAHAEVQPQGTDDGKAAVSPPSSPQSRDKDENEIQGSDIEADLDAPPIETLPDQLEELLSQLRRTSGFCHHPPERALAHTLPTRNIKSAKGPTLPELST